MPDNNDEYITQLSEVEQTLASLGYEGSDRRALRAVHDQNDNERPKPDDLEAGWNVAMAQSPGRLKKGTVTR